MSATVEICTQPNDLQELTPFEQEVLQIIEKFLTGCQWESVYALTIYYQGQKYFGDHWGGARRSTTSGESTLPTIDAALGRLRRKGYLQIVGESATTRSRRHVWDLTDAGKAFFGLVPAA